MSVTSCPRRTATSAHAMPAGPAPTTATRRDEAALGGTSGMACSKEQRGLTAHCGWPPSTNSFTQPSWQPMHGLIWSTRPA